ncbi:MAG: ATP-binding protein [Proteobacteria bacterium]|nr:ATP-binding protein [Pseudomonadota bacterium]
MKYKKEWIFSALILLIFGLFIYLETHLPFFKKFLPIEENKLIVIVLNINLLLILLLIFLITRTLFKAYIEKKRGIWGSGLKTKLTVTMLIISIVPSFTLSILATGFFHISMDKWFGQKIEDTMDSALILSHYYYDDLFQRYEKTGKLLAGNIDKRKLLEKEKELNTYLRSDRYAKLNEYFSVHDLSGNVVVSNLPQGIDSRLSGKIEAALKKDNIIREVIPIKDGEIIVAGTRIPDEYGNTQAILFTGDILKIQSTARIKEITSTHKEFKESRAFKKILKYSFYIPLSLITVMTIFFCVWVGIKMATEITIPIERVKEGVSIIAQGKFDVNLEDRGKDEIGTLVSAFNSMAKELKVTKDEIEAKRRYMEIILDNVTTGIISTDKRGDILFLNKAAQNILGVEKETLEGTPLKEVLGGDFKKYMKSFLKEARGTGDGSVTKYMRLNLQKDIKYIRASLTILKDDTNKTEGFIITFDDITHVVRAEKLATWREVAKKLTHEIKNPLTPIILSAERIRRRLLARMTDSDKEILDETTSVIIKSVGDIKGIVNELTKLTHSSQTMIIEDINSVLEETISIYKNLYHNITFRFEQSLIPIFRMDRDGIKRAMINLITNSAKAINNKEGIITISTKFDADKGVGIIVIADNGSGVADEDKGKVFDPYFTRDKDGMGLGLAIVHSIILEHHGRIYVEDNIPEGAKFIIELPVVGA